MRTYGYATGGAKVTAKVVETKWPEPRFTGRANVLALRPVLVFLTGPGVGPSSKVSVQFNQWSTVSEDMMLSTT